MNYEGISVATLSGQLSWITFCNRCGLVLYQTKSEHGLYFPLGRWFLNPINNTIPVLGLLRRCLLNWQAQVP